MKSSRPPKGITEEQWTSLAQAVLDGCRKFYADPENVKKFEEWKKAKAQRVAEA